MAITNRHLYTIYNMFLLCKHDRLTALDDIVQEVKVDSLFYAIFHIVIAIDIARAGIGIVEVDTIILPGKLVLITQVKLKLTILNDRYYTYSRTRTQTHPST